jgi:hypothetical protein
LNSSNAEIPEYVSGLLSADYGKINARSTNSYQLWNLGSRIQ